VSIGFGKDAPYQCPTVEREYILTSIDQQHWRADTTWEFLSQGFRCALPFRRRVWVRHRGDFVRRTVMRPFGHGSSGADATLVNERGSIYAACIDDGRLGAAIQLAQRSPPALEWYQRPRFLADSSVLVFPAEQPWAFGVVPFLRVVALID
jgi:hypothetical protein